MSQASSPQARTRTRARTAGILVLLMLALALVLRLAGGHHHLPPRELTIFLSADTRGHLEPCACRTDPSGGMTVRATILKRQPARPRLLIDAGNVIYSRSDFDLFKFDYLLQAMEMMRYDVVNLGPKEVMLSRDQVLMMVQRHPRLPFISCNVLETSSRQPVVRPYLIKSVSGFRIGFLGVVKDDLEVIGKDLTVAPPLECLSVWVPEVARRCDYLVVIAFADQKMMKAIADQFYEVDAVFGGDVAESSTAPEQMNQAVAFSVTGEGKVLGRISLRRTREGKLQAAAGEIIKVESTTPGDPEVLKIADAFKTELRRQAFGAPPQDEKLEAIPVSQTTADDHYVGAATCKECHEAEYGSWKRSSHARGLQALKPSNHERDPECLACHTTGYQSADGFLGEEKTPHLGMVECESCHGRGQRHVQAMQRHEKPAYSTFRVVTPNTCLACHDKENSPRFQFKTYWPRIAHGRAREG